MATIVEHLEDGNRYVLIGPGYGMYHAVKPHIILGNWGRSAETGSQKLICVANEAGELGWLQAHNVRVVAVDGESPSDLLAT